MLRIKSIVLLCIIVLFLSATVCAQQQQYTDRQLMQAQENMDEIKNKLENRIQALQAEWEAIKKEQEELARISRGGSLRGSKKNKYLKRNADFNARMMKYTEDKDKLRQDAEAYKAAIRNMEAAAQEMTAPQTDKETETQTSRPPEEQATELTDVLNNAGINVPVSAVNQEEIDKITALLDRRRAELLEEYKVLKAEQQRIAMQGQKGQTKENAPSVSEQVYQINAKLKDFAKTRKRFNDAVHSVNEILGQNVQPLPGP